jgi:hypothetical protein
MIYTNMSVVFGFCFHIDQFYTNSFNGEIDGWTLIHDRIPKYFNEYQSCLTYKDFGNHYQPNSRGICIILKEYTNDTHNCWIDLDLQNMKMSMDEFDISNSLNMFRHMIETIGLTNPEQYKPTLRVICSV